jgi:hypothetical protein
VQPANQVPIRLSRLLAVVAGGAVIARLCAPRVAQDPAYHDFADSRPVLGIPNSLNVLSTLPFAIVGLAGLVAVSSMRNGHRCPYPALFAGPALTSSGRPFTILPRQLAATATTTWASARIWSRRCSSGLWFLVAMTRQRAAIAQKQDPSDAVSSTRPVS